MSLLLRPTAKTYSAAVTLSHWPLKLVAILWERELFYAEVELGIMMEILTSFEGALVRSPWLEVPVRWFEVPVRWFAS